MLNESKYVVQSLELHLFFARIMKEHSIFLEAGFTPKDADFSKEADNFKRQFEAILMNSVQMSSGIISKELLSSGEIMTNFTLGTEQKTEALSGISINENITKMEMQLHSSDYVKVTPDLVRYVRELNASAKKAIASLIAFKERILNYILSCKIYTFNYPLLIEHILREARHYQSFIIYLDNGQDLENYDIKQIELFWDQIMMEHALFIRGLLDPTEGALINTANNFAGEYAKLLEQTMNATDTTLKTITNETLNETLKYKDFKEAGTKGISECKIRSVIIPLLADHVLRESNHFIRLLKTSK